MTLDQFVHNVLEFVRAHAAWAPFLVAALTFAESLAVISFVVPATVILVGIGGLVGASGIAFWPVWAGAVAGAVLGDWLSYGVGRYLQDGIDRTWPFSRYPHFVRHAEAFTRRWGVWSVFIGRFSGPLRAFVPLAAGVFDLPFWTFQAANISSALIWAFILLAPGEALSWLTP